MSAPLPDVFAAIMVFDRPLTLEERLMLAQETYGTTHTCIIGGPDES